MGELAPNQPMGHQFAGNGRDREGTQEPEDNTGGRRYQRMLKDEVPGLLFQNESQRYEVTGSFQILLGHDCSGGVPILTKNNYSPYNNIV